MADLKLPPASLSLSHPPQNEGGKGGISMMEQTHAGEGHDDAVLVALFDDQIITDGAAGLGDVFDTGGHATLDRVSEGEECVAAQSDGITAVQPCPLLFRSQRLGTLGEIILPDTLGADILFVAIDVAVDDIVTTGTTQIGTEGQGKGLGMLTQEPGIGLAAGKTDAMHSGLLTGAHADGLTIVGKANRVALGVFQGDQGDDQIQLGAVGQLLVGGDDVLQQMLADLEIVAALLEGDAENLLALLGIGNVVGSILTTL